MTNEEKFDIALAAAKLRRDGKHFEADRLLETIEVSGRGELTRWFIDGEILLQLLEEYGGDQTTTIGP